MPSTYNYKITQEDIDRGYLLLPDDAPKPGYKLSLTDKAKANDILHLPVADKIENDPKGFGQHQSGAKLDAGKVDMSLLLLMWDALVEVARVGTYGAKKYTRGGFLEVPDGATRYTAAMLRHLGKELKETYDYDPFMDTPEGLEFKGKIRHDAQTAWNAIARLQLTLRKEMANEESRSNTPD